MSTTRQNISKEFKKLNDYELKAFYELLRCYTGYHKSKYPEPHDVEEAGKPFLAELEEYVNSGREEDAEENPNFFMPVMAAYLGLAAFISHQKKSEEAL